MTQYISFIIFIGFAACLSTHAQPSQKFIIDAHGAIIRGDISLKQIALVFTGDEFADGGATIRKTLRQNKIPAAFFLTGKFYDNPKFKSLIRSLKKDGHYLGAHSDQHLLYADWTKRDSLLVTEGQFKSDLQNNYERMSKFGVEQKDAPFFLPPYEWHNTAIARWTKEVDLTLVNFSPGTRSTADYTYPEMAERYRNSEEIYRSIVEYEAEDPNGLNGFILLVHIGTDPRRTDKFYNKLDSLVNELKARGYDFVSIIELLK